ncbi:MAG: Rrf2 family transcriptional regulator [Cyanobacteriota bacterium]
MKGILRISDAAAIAIHTLIILASNQDKLFSNKEIAIMLDVSDNHLAKILQRLARAGLVESIRGPRGGFNLKKNTDQITLLDVYEAIDGPLELSDCLLARQFCNSNCLLGDFIKNINNQFVEYFKTKKLSDF